VCECVGLVRGQVGEKPGEPLAQVRLGRAQCPLPLFGEREWLTPAAEPVTAEEPAVFERGK
jgi:hypothetical protein